MGILLRLALTAGALQFLPAAGGRSATPFRSGSKAHSCLLVKENRN
jgi:hypothetical protein